MQLEYSTWGGGVPRRAINKQRYAELAEAANYRVGKMAVLCGLSTRQLERDFRRHVGSSPQTWLNERRMQAARRLLLTGDSVKKVALDLGYKQVSYFCTRFKVVNRMTPTQFALLHSRTNGDVGET